MGRGSGALRVVDRAWGADRGERPSRRIAPIVLPPPLPIVKQYALDREREHHEHVAKHGIHDDEHEHDEAEKGKAGGAGSFGGGSSSGAGRDSDAEGVQLVDRRRQVALAMSVDGGGDDLVPWAAKQAAADSDATWGSSVKKRRSFLEVINPISSARGGAGESPRLFARPPPPPPPPPQLVLPRDVSAAALLHDSPGMKGVAARGSPSSLTPLALGGGGVEGSPLSLEQRKHAQQQQGRVQGEGGGSSKRAPPPPPPARALLPRG